MILTRLPLRAIFGSTVVLFALAGLAVILTLQPAAAQLVDAQSAPNPGGALGPALISTSAQGTATAAPDVAYVTVGVDAQGRTAQEASATNASSMTAVVAAVKAQGVADQDIQTSGLSINPVFADNQNRQITGYRVTNSVTVAVNDVSKTSAVVDAAVASGANSGYGIRFGLKDSSALQLQALANALQQATAKANTLATTAGLKLGSAYTITESGASPPVIRALAAPVPQSEAASTPVQAGQLSVTAGVQVSFTYTR